MKDLIARARKLLSRVQRTRPLRAWKRYSDAHGNVLAGGVGYFAFFSIFPAVALAFTVFGFVLRGHPDLMHSVTDALRQQLPGMIKDPAHPHAGGIISVTAPGAGALTITGAVSFVGLVMSGMGWLGAMRTGIRAVFGVEDTPGNVVTDKLRDLGVMMTLGLGIALSGVFTSAASTVIRFVADAIGLGGAAWLLQVAVFVLSALADTGLMMLLLRVLSGVEVPWRGLFQGALMGGVGLTVMKIFAGQLLSHATSNPLLASLGIVVGLLFWLNLMSRITLLSSAWAANDLDARAERERAREPGREARERARASGRHTGAARGAARTRATDRASLAAGVVLGAGTAVAVSTLGRAAVPWRRLRARR